MSISRQRAGEIIAALRRGTVPHSSLDAFCVGLERFEPTLDAELDATASGGHAFKAVRGEYGCGKTFFTRWLADRARKRGFVTSEVPISDSETPLHKLEAVYCQLIERLATADTQQGALQTIVDSWLHVIEEDAVAEGVSPTDEAAFIARTDALLEGKLGKVKQFSPMFAAAIRGYRKALLAKDRATADGLLAWASGQPNVAASVKKFAGIKGDLKQLGALGFLRGVLALIRDAGYSGMVVVLDEVETIQRVQSNFRNQGLQVLRELIDGLDAKQFPGMMLLITGTTALYDGPRGIQQLAPLAQRLHVDFPTDPRFENPRLVQLRLPAFDLDRLALVGSKVRDIFLVTASAPDRVRLKCDDEYVRQLAAAVAGQLGGQVGVAPRIFLKKLVSGVLDMVDLHDEFNPRTDYMLKVEAQEMTAAERHATGATNVDDIPLEL
jgi:hypothetical protein